MLLLYCLISHLVGDFLFQNDWMQRKSKSDFVCTVHVLAYSLAFVPLFFYGLSAMAFAVIMLEHWIQDRYALNRVWMAMVRTTPPERWPVGPLCVDQVLHIAFIASVIAIQQGTIQ